MMTNNIGKFIQKVRKEEGLTQKELAEKVGVSDKTISKWENGNSAPDTSMLLPLCETLHVTVNELLSGEKIPPEDYSMKAEKTIMSLMKENEEGKKSNRISRIMGIILLIVAVVLLFISTQMGIEGLTVFPVYFIDAPSLVFIVVLAAGVVLVSGVKEKSAVLALLSKIIIPIGLMVSIVSAIIMLSMISDMSTLWPNLAVVTLSFLYSCIAKIVLEVLVAKNN